MATKIALTTENIHTLPEGMYRDAHRIGFVLYVAKTGIRTFGLYRSNPATGKPLRKALGRVNEMSLKEARLAFDTLALKLRKKQVEDTPETSPATFGEVVERLDRDWVTKAFDLHFQDWLDKPMTKVSAKDVERRIAQIKAGSAAESRRRDARAGKPIRDDAGLHALASAGRALRALFNFAAKTKAYVGDNHGDLFPRHSSEPRLRVLRPDEEKRFLDALNDPTLQPWARPFFELLLETGSRWGVLISARWSEMDLERGTWVLPGRRTKNRRVNRVILTERAVEILKELHERDPASPWVFPSPQKEGCHLTDVSHQWARIKALANLSDVTPHDLRRTYGSKLADAGESLLVIAAAMNHRSTRTTEAYYSHVSDEAVRLMLKRRG